MWDPLSTLFIQLLNKHCSASQPLASLDEPVFQTREGHKVNTSELERLHVP